MRYPDPVRFPLALLILVLGCGGAAAPAAGPESDWEVDIPAAMTRPVSAETPARAKQVWTPPSVQAAERPAARRYRGRRIDLDLKQADLHNVFRLLADVGGINIVVSEDVSGAVTLKLRHVPWDQAFEAIVRLEKLEVTRSGNLYLVMPR